MRRGVIYARYSCDKQTENSIRGQVRECTLFAERNDIQIINVYSDEAISGRTDRRPAFLRMFRDAAQHQFDVIIVWKGDRFSRNRADAAKYKNELKKLNIQLLSATEANVTGPEAVLMDGINEAFAEFYSVELAEKVNRGMYQNLLDGKYIGGPLILGYKLEDHKVVVDEESAKLVKEIFDMYVHSDITVREIVKKLNASGHRIRGKEFKYSTIQGLLSNRKYVGEFRYKGQIHLNCYPAIISDGLFEVAQRKLGIKKASGGQHKTTEKYILSGKLFCGECGTPMKAYAGISPNNHRLYKYYKCGGTTKEGCHKVRFDKNALEKSVLTLLIKHIQEDMEVDRVANRIMESLAKVNPELIRLETALSETEQAIKNYKYALEKGLNLDDTIDRLKELDCNKKAYQHEIDRLKMQEKIIRPDVVRVFLQQLIGKDYTKKENIDYLINVMVYKIVIYKNGNFKVILNIGGDDDPDKLESTVQLLIGQDHQTRQK